MEEISILLVEDEKIVALDLINSLKDLGYSVVGTASSGEAALVMAGELNPSLILMDIQLSGDIDGIEAAGQIYSIYNIPVVYITAHIDDGTLDRARRSGQYGFVSKNADAQALHSSIQIAIERFARDSEVRKREARLSAAIGSIGDAVIRLDSEGSIVGWDGNATGVFGHSEKEAVGRHISFLSTRYSKEEINDAVAGVKNGGQYPRFEVLLEKADGTRVLASVKITNISDSAGNISGMTVVASDITERRIVEKAVLDVSDRERTRIGQDLHDGLGQRLTGIALSLKAMEGQVSSSTPLLAAELSRVYGQVRQAIDETRRLSKGLMPPSLRSDGLPMALESLVTSVDPSGPELVYSMGTVAEIGDPFIETQLFRIAQEAITNAQRHGDCSRILVSLERSAADLILSVSDDGDGIGDESNGGIGLRIMEYRSDAIGGKLSITSKDGQGTVVSCAVRIPCWEEQQ